MTFDPRTGLHQLRALRDGIAQRMARLRALGLTNPPPAATSAFDAFATSLAARTHMPVAMINLIGDDQRFVGLHVPTHTPGGDLFPPVERTMSLDHGYCPEVVDRGKSLTLPDVCVNPRFAGNEVVDRMGIRTYVGAPLTEPGSGIILGTVCAIGTEPRPKTDGRELWHLIMQAAEDAQELVMDHTIRPPRHPN
ncbi:GAF domain-containing protein [Streptomyces sp. NPDC059247]|uniref:GAF domain-containing protein n=1 Tax=Streptomyces sp. NPDC059247 TaxID=3346790 RepID=UPI003695890B